MRKLRIRIAAPLMAALCALGALLAPTAAFAANCTSPAFYQTIDAGGSTLSSMHWSSVPATGPSGCIYSSIRIIGYARAHQTTTCDSEMSIRLGNTAIDTGDDYTWVEGKLNGSVLAQSGPGALNQIKISLLPCDLESPNDVAGFEILIPNAFRTDFGKQIIGHSTVESEEIHDPYGVAIGEFAGSWDVNSVVTDVQLFPYISGGFEPHSAATLWVE